MDILGLGSTIFRGRKAAILLMLEVGSEGMSFLKYPHKCVL